MTPRPISVAVDTSGDLEPPRALASWYTEGSTGTKIPDYLDPAVDGVLTEKSQTTKGMGVYPDSDGQNCIDQAIWEADTIDPGTTPLKWKLGYGEQSNSDICQS